MNTKASCVELLREIIESTSASPIDPHSFPKMLDGENDQIIYITPDIAIGGDISLFSNTLMNNWFQEEKSNFRYSEWNQIVYSALARAIMHHNEAKDSDRNADTVLETVKQNIHDLLGEIQEREYIFGCHFCNASNVEPFCIGPVRIEPRFVWLARTQEAGRISKITRSHIDKTWRGIRLRKRVPSVDQVRERSILGAVGNGDFVCTVSVGPTGAEAGLQKALTAVRVATTAIALAMRKPSSALNSMNLIYDRQPHLREYFSFSPDGRGRVGKSRSFIPGGVRGMNLQKWQIFLKSWDKLFCCAGEVIQLLTHGSNRVACPKVMGTLYQALLWFHEGCREDIDAMAIVKFCSSMDALACGKELTGIQDLIKARLTVRDQSKLRRDLKEIYNASRSRTVHGTNDKFGHDWSDRRSRAEQYARMSLIACLLWAADHPGVDDPKRFSQ